MAIPSITDLNDIFSSNNKVQEEINVIFTEAAVNGIKNHPALAHFLGRLQERPLSDEDRDNATVKAKLIVPTASGQRVKQGSLLQYGTVNEYYANAKVATYADNLILQESIYKALIKPATDKAALQEKWDLYSSELKDFTNDLFETIYALMEQDLFADTTNPMGILSLKEIVTGNTCMGIDGSQADYSFWMPAGFKNTLTPTQLRDLAVERGKENMFMTVLDNCYQGLEGISRPNIILMGANAFKILELGTKIDGNDAWNYKDMSVMEYRGRTYLKAPEDSIKMNQVMGFDSRYLKYYINTGRLKNMEIVKDQDRFATYKSTSALSVALATNKRAAHFLLELEGVSDSVPITL